VFGSRDVIVLLSVLCREEQYHAPVTVVSSLQAAGEKNTHDPRSCKNCLSELRLRDSDIYGGGGRGWGGMPLDAGRGWRRVNAVMS